METNKNKIYTNIRSRGSDLENKIKIVQQKENIQRSDMEIKKKFTRLRVEEQRGGNL